jgi:hypothetical protein
LHRNQIKEEIMKSIKKLVRAIAAYPWNAILAIKMRYFLHPVYSKHNKVKRTVKGTVFLILFGAAIGTVLFAIQRDSAARAAEQRANDFENQIKEGHDRLSYMLDNDPEITKILSTGRFSHPVKRPRSKENK